MSPFGTYVRTSVCMCVELDGRIFFSSFFFLSLPIFFFFFLLSFFFLCSFCSSFFFPILVFFCLLAVSRNSTYFIPTYLLTCIRFLSLYVILSTRHRTIFCFVHYKTSPSSFCRGCFPATIALKQERSVLVFGGFHMHRGGGGVFGISNIYTVVLLKMSGAARTLYVRARGGWEPTAQSCASSKSVAVVVTRPRQKGTTGSLLFCFLSCVGGIELASGATFCFVFCFVRW